MSVPKTCMEVRGQLFGVCSVLVPYVDRRGLTQVTRLDDKCLYMQNHL